VNDDTAVEKRAENRAIDELYRRFDAFKAAVLVRREYDRLEWHFDRVRKAIQALERAEIGQEAADEPFGFYQYLHDKARGRYSR
jgi:hypothetical protein